MAGAQARLPGMTPKRIQEIQDAAVALKDVRDERMDLSEKEEKLQEALKAVMKKHDIRRYRLDDDYEAIIEANEPRAYVRRIKKKTVKKAGTKE